MKKKIIITLLIINYSFIQTMNFSYSEQVKLIPNKHAIDTSENNEKIMKLNKKISQQYKKCILELQALKEYSKTSNLEAVTANIDTIKNFINEHEQMPQQLQKKYPYKLKLQKHNCFLKCCSCCRKNSLSNDEREMNYFIDLNKSKIKKSLLQYLKYYNADFQPQSCCSTYFCSPLFLIKYLLLTYNNK